MGRRGRADRRRVDGQAEVDPEGVGGAPLLGRRRMGKEGREGEQVPPAARGGPADPQGTGAIPATASVPLRKRDVGEHGSSFRRHLLRSQCAASGAA